MTTLNYYNTHAREYVDQTRMIVLTQIYDIFLKQLPKGGRILDCGCGGGRDVLEFAKRGFKIVAMDGSGSMCELASAFTGQKILHKTFAEIDWQAEFDGIWACASLLHLTQGQLTQVLPLLLNALKPNGTIYASFKLGTGERIDDKGRFYTDYTPDQVKQLFAVAGFGALRLWTTRSQDPKIQNEDFVNVMGDRKSMTDPAYIEIL